MKEAEEINKISCNYFDVVVSKGYRQLKQFFYFKHNIDPSRLNLNCFNADTAWVSLLECKMNTIPLFTIKVPDKRQQYNAKDIQYYVNANGCWMCVSHAPNVYGYPTISISNKRIRIHRHVYENYYNTKVAKLFLCHICDNPLCINPTHMFMGTQADNIKDAVKKKRMCSGEARSKLKTENVIAIRNSKDSVSSLAVKYNVSKSSIRLIQNGKRWKYV